MKRRAFLIGLLAAGPVLAMDPSEMLTDPALEARARDLDHQIRCVKCQSEAVASSNASWAVDARRSIRELVADGASDTDVRAWFVERYGEFVLMDPPKTGSNLALWLAGPAMLGIGAIGAVSYLRGRSNADPADGPSDLSAEEQARLQEILKD